MRRKTIERIWAARDLRKSGLGHYQIANRLRVTVNQVRRWVGDIPHPKSKLRKQSPVVTEAERLRETILAFQRRMGWQDADKPTKAGQPDDRG